MMPDPRLGDLGLEIDMKVYVPLLAMKALAEAAPKNDCRYYLNGVCVQTTARETILTITNGHYLISHRLELDRDVVQDVCEFILPREFIRNLKPHANEIKGGPQEVEIEAKPKCLNFRVTIPMPISGTVSIDSIDGRFPDWRRVMPEKFEGELAHCNHQYLSTVLKAVAACTGSKAELIPLMGSGKEGAVGISIHGTTVAVCMPLRCEQPETAFPAWARPPEKATVIQHPAVAA